MPLHRKTMPMPCQTQTWHPYHHYNLLGESHILYYPKLERTFHSNVYILLGTWPHHNNPTKTLNYQPLVDTPEDAQWYVTLTILKTCIWAGFHTNNITNLFRRRYPFNAPCMQQIHLIAIKYLTLFMLTKRKTGKPPIANAPHLSMHQNHHIQTTKPQEWTLQHGAKTHSIRSYKGIENLLELNLWESNPTRLQWVKTPCPHNTHSWDTQH